MKKIKFLTLMLIAVFTLNSVVFAANIKLGQGFDVNVNGRAIKVSVENGRVADYNINELMSIAAKHPDAENIIIYEKVYRNELPIHDINSNLPPGQDQINSDPILTRTEYSTTKTITTSDATARTDFIISVAKGQETTLSSSYTGSLSYSIAGSYSNFSNLGISGTISKTYSRSDKFTGPPENSTNNTRRYYLEFHEERGNWTQYYDIYDLVTGRLWKMGFTKGTYTQPLFYYAYSVDSKVN